MACVYIFVNDGSKDNSFVELTKIYQANKDRVKVVNFSRNFGHQIAVTAGQDHTSGDAVIIMDTDLQDPPETCLDLITQWQKGFDIVYALQDEDFDKGEGLQSIDRKSTRLNSSHT